MRVLAIIAMTVGAAILVAAWPVYRYQSRLLEQDFAAIASFEQDITESQANLAVATSRADSTTLQDLISGRQAAVRSRAYHAAARQTTIANWWSLTGSGSSMIGAATLLLVLGTIALRRALTAPWNLPPVDAAQGPHG